MVCSNIELNTAVTKSTVFELASVIKQMTATLIASLASQGKLSLDDKLSKYIDSIPRPWETITLLKLLGHMAGLEHRFEPKFNESFLLFIGPNKCTNHGHEKTLSLINTCPFFKSGRNSISG